MEEILNVTDEQNGVRVFELNRPKVLNALSPALVLRLHEELDRLRDDYDRARVLVIVGAGRAFCSGADLSPHESPVEGFFPGFVGSQQRGLLDAQRYYSSLIVKLRRVPQPVIAAVNGPCAGGGFSLALASDIRIVDPAAFFVAAQVNIGQAASEMGATYLLPRIVGGRAAEILLTGRRVEALEAERIGLANEVTQPGSALERARSIAALLAGKAPLGLRLSKEGLEVSASASSLEQAVAADDRSQVLCALTADLSEGVQAYREGRLPRYFG
jgi:enoyl-CoA hydratase